MSDEFYIGHSALEELSREFGKRAESLGEQLAKFKPKTDSEAIHDGFGILTESEEITSSYIELADSMREAVEGLQTHLDDISDGLKQNNKNTEAADEAIEDMFKGK